VRAEEEREFVEEEREFVEDEREFVEEERVESKIFSGVCCMDGNKHYV